MLQPNPACGYTTLIGAAAGALTLHDASGRLVRSFATVQPGQRISLAGLKAGIYFAALPDRDIRTRLVVSR